MADTIFVLLLVAAAMAFTYRLVMLVAQGRRSGPSPGSPSRPAEVDVSSVVPRASREDDDDLDVTKIRLPSLSRTDDWAMDSAAAPSSSRRSNVVPIVYDKHADVDVATNPRAYFLVSAVAQTAIGRRKRNEDSYLILQDPPVFAVADGMGGYRGGEIASRMAVEALEDQLVEEGPTNDATALPRRAAHLLEAVYRANAEVFDRAQGAPELENMGTTLVAARFSPRKKRVYIAHVGDSRCYVYRKGKLRQITSDHTVGALHEVDAPVAGQLVRAIGVRSQVEVDLILGKPRARDRYLLCSDGLTRMVPDERIAQIMAEDDEPARNVEALVKAAEDGGARDNITVIVVKVQPLQNGASSIAS